MAEPDHKALPDAFTEHLLGFGAYLKAHQFQIDPATLADAMQISSLGYVDNRRLLNTGLKSCFCRNRDQWQRFDDLFTAWFLGAESDTQLNPNDSPPGPAALLTRHGERLLGFAGTSEKENPHDELFGAGDYKALSLADFRFVFDPAQQHALRCLIDQLARRIRRRRARGYRITEKGRSIDLRHSLRLAARHGGVVTQLRYRLPRRRLPRFVLLLDISQSMEVYSKLFLRFSCHLMRLFDQSAAFAFNTELIKLGEGHRRLDEITFEQIMNSAGKGWLGGTRIAHALREFQSGHARHWLDRRTTLVVFSDGCDTARPAELAKEVARLHRQCSRLVWINPLLGRMPGDKPDPRMDPLQPHIDCYRSAHNLQSLAALENDLIKATQ